MITESFVREHLDRFEDFWHRREAAIQHEVTIEAYGYPLHFATNDPLLLEVPRLCVDRYSRSKLIENAAPLHLNFILDRQLPIKRVPINWPSRLRYIGQNDWLTVNAEPWVNSFADLKQHIGLAFVSESIAQKPLLLSRYIGDCFVLNMLLRTGWGELHASCLYRDRRAILLIAPHNTGKSTTAFRLAMNGYQLLSDGMTYVRPHPFPPLFANAENDQGQFKNANGGGLGRGLELLGYPIGEVKLRMDMLKEFPQIKKHGRKTLVREDAKMVFNLREAMPDRMCEDSIWPQEIVVCLLERVNSHKTVADPIDRSAALNDLLPNSSHLTNVSLLTNNLNSIEQLLDRARCYRLKIGSDVTGILKAIENL